MTNTVNRQIQLSARPANYPKESDFDLVESPVPEPLVGKGSEAGAIKWCPSKKRPEK